MEKEANVVTMEDTINYILELIFQEEGGAESTQSRANRDPKKGIQSQGCHVLAIQNLVPPTTYRKLVALGLYLCLQPKFPLWINKLQQKHFTTASLSTLP